MKLGIVWLGWLINFVLFFGGGGGWKPLLLVWLFFFSNIFNLSLGSGNDYSQDVLNFLPKTTVCLHRSPDITCSLSQAEEEARIRKEEEEERLRKEEEQRQAVLEKARAIEEARRLEEEAKRKAEEEARRKVCMMMVTIMIKVKSLYLTSVVPTVTRLVSMEADGAPFIPLPPSVLRFAGI